MSDTTVAVIDKPRELSVFEVEAQVAKVQTLMKSLMQEGTHYGESYPGDTKKNLLKPGADKLCFMFRLRPDFSQEIKELHNGHMEVITRCQIFHIESGMKIAEGVGLASTMESKYRWRNAARKCPKCGKEAIIAGKKEYGGGWVCFKKKDGCGAKFAEDDRSIMDQTVGKVENTDIADTYNTVIKMSKKRAYVDATITACAASDIFTQDAEDFRDVTETTEALAQEAAKYETPAPQAAEQNTEHETRESILKNIKEIVETLSPDQMPFFTATEIDQERTAARSANLKALKEQRLRLRQMLDKREEEYEPVPFGDDKDQLGKTTASIPAEKPASMSDEFNDHLRNKNKESTTADTSGDLDIS